MHKNLITSHCLGCGGTFKVHPWYLARGQKYCSKDCYYRVRWAPVASRRCENCGQRFRVDSSNTSRGRLGKFCGRACSNAHRRNSPDAIRKRLSAYIRKDGPVPAHRPELGPCWVWTGPADRKGYGHIYARDKRQSAAKLVWEFEYDEPFPEGESALHRCDYPPCVRPSHVYAGDHLDNARDAIERGQLPVGERCHNAKLTEEAVREIRASDLPPKTLAARFGLHVSTIHTIQRRETWKHVA